jgi:hypothetical protein
MTSLQRCVVAPLLNRGSGRGICHFIAGSRDGATPVKLNLALMARFFSNIRRADFDLDSAIEALRDTYRSMAELLTPDEAGDKLA